MIRKDELELHSPQAHDHEKKEELTDSHNGTIPNNKFDQQKEITYATVKIHNGSKESIDTNDKISPKDDLSTGKKIMNGTGNGGAKGVRVNLYGKIDTKESRLQNLDLLSKDHEDSEKQRKLIFNVNGESQEKHVSLDRDPFSSGQKTHPIGSGDSTEDGADIKYRVKTSAQKSSEISDLNSSDLNTNQSERGNNQQKGKNIMYVVKNSSHNNEKSDRPSDSDTYNGSQIKNRNIQYKSVGNFSGNVKVPENEQNPGIIILSKAAENIKKQDIGPEMESQKIGSMGKREELQGASQEIKFKLANIFNKESAVFDIINETAKSFSLSEEKGKHQDNTLGNPDIAYNKQGMETAMENGQKYDDNVQNGKAENRDKKNVGKEIHYETLGRYQKINKEIFNTADRQNDMENKEKRNDGYQAGELEIQLDTNPSNAKETVIKQPKTKNIEEHDSNGKNIKYEHVRNFAIQNTPAETGNQLSRKQTSSLKNDKSENLSEKETSGTENVHGSLTMNEGAIRKNDNLQISKDIEYLVTGVKGAGDKTIWVKNENQENLSENGKMRKMHYQIFKKYPVKNEKQEIRHQKVTLDLIGSHEIPGDKDKLESVVQAIEQNKDNKMKNYNEGFKSVIPGQEIKYLKVSNNSISETSSQIPIQILANTEILEEKERHNQINFTSPVENMLKLSSGNDSYQGTSKSKGQKNKQEKTIREEIEMQFSTANRGIHCSIKK